MGAEKNERKQKQKCQSGREVISFVPDLFRHLSSQLSVIFLGIPVPGG